NNILHYTQDDLMNFYSWAPTFLPDPATDGGSGEALPHHSPSLTNDQSAQSLVAQASSPAGSSGVPPQSVTSDEDPGRRREQADPPATSQLHELRQRLVQLLAARASTLPPLPGGTSYASPQTPEPSHSVEPSDVAPTSTSAGSGGVPPSSINDPASSIANPEPPATNHSSPVISSPSPVVSDPGKVISDNGPLITGQGRPITDNSLLTDLRDLITRFVVLPEFAAETLALWVVHTYAFTLREVTTYIAVVSPEKRCGKTTLLELLGCLAQESIAAANISPSALFRVIEEARPTLIIDEADTFKIGRASC